MSALLEIREVRIVLNAFWPMLKQGLIYSIPLTLVSFAIGMVIAIMSALLIINRVPLLSQLMRFYVWIFRGTPLLVQLFIVYWGICNPMKISNLVACVIALSLNVGAYASETIRAAIIPPITPPKIASPPSRMLKMERRSSLYMLKRNTT